jgi:hypothetical protein
MNRERINTMPDELILNFIISDISNFNLCKTNRKFRRICNENKNYIFRRYLLGLGIKTTFDYNKSLIMQQIFELRRQYPRLDFNSINSSYNNTFVNGRDSLGKLDVDLIGPIGLIIQNDWFQLFDVLIANKIINIDTLLPHYYMLWNLIKVRKITKELFNVIIKYRRDYLNNTILYANSNSLASNFVGGARKKTFAKKRLSRKKITSNKKRSTKKRSAKKRLSRKKRTSNKKRSTKKRSAKKKFSAKKR